MRSGSGSDLYGARVTFGGTVLDPPDLDEQRLGLDALDTDTDGDSISDGDELG